MYACFLWIIQPLRWNYPLKRFRKFAQNSHFLDDLKTLLVWAKKQTCCGFARNKPEKKMVLPIKSLWFGCWILARILLSGTYTTTTTTTTLLLDGRTRTWSTAIASSATPQQIAGALRRPRRLLRMEVSENATIWVSTSQHILFTLSKPIFGNELTWISQEFLACFLKTSLWPMDRNVPWTLAYFTFY